jgi:hypothetical protein
VLGNYLDAERNPGEELSSAANHGDAATVSKLLSMPGAHSFINYQDEHGFAPLHFAAQNDQQTVTVLLIAARCNIDLQDKDGTSPIHIATGKGHKSVMKHLIAGRCNVDLQNKNGVTPLHAAAGAGYEIVTKHLQFGNEAAVAMLLAARCNVDLQTKDGDTAMKVAQLKGHIRITELIRKSKNDAYTKRTEAKAKSDKQKKMRELFEDERKAKKQQEDADRAAMRELLEQEEKAATDTKRIAGKAESSKMKIFEKMKMREVVEELNFHQLHGIANHAAAVMQFMEIGAEMGFAREQVMKALRAAFMNPAGNPELALEYLITEQPQRIDKAMNARACENVREVVITDTDGDTMIFKLTSDGARVQQWYNGLLEIDDVKHIEVDLETGQVRDCGEPIGRFTIRPEERQEKMEALSSLLARVRLPELRKSMCASVQINSDVDARQDAMDVDEPALSSSSAASLPHQPPSPPPPPKQLSRNPTEAELQHIINEVDPHGDGTVLGSVYVKKYADRAMKERLEEEEKAGAGADADYTKRTEAKAESEKIKTENLLVVPDRGTIEMSRRNAGKQSYRKSEVSPKQTKKQQEVADRAMKELLEGEEKAAAGAACDTEAKAESEKIDAAAVMQFMEMGFAREQVMKALRAASMNPAGNPELALEYLITGIPEPPPIPEQPQRPQRAIDRAMKDVLQADPKKTKPQTNGAGEHEFGGSDKPPASNPSAIETRRNTCGSCHACRYRTVKAEAGCRDGPNCSRSRCDFAHASRLCTHHIAGGARKLPGRIACNHGIACMKSQCKFAHPSPSLKCTIDSHSMPTAEVQIESFTFCSVQMH